MDNITIVQNIKNNGIVKVENFLNQQNLYFVDKILKNKKNSKSSDNTYFFRSKGNFLLKKFLYCKFFSLINCLKMIHLSKKLKLEELSSKIHGRQTKLVTIDSYYSKISNEKVIDWHVDQGYSGKLNPKKILNPDHGIIKLFVYLTDVSSNNGCLGYISGSNILLYYLKLGIFNGNIKYKPYWNLKDLRNLIQEKDYRNYLETKIKKEQITQFLDQTHFITKDIQDTNEYDFELKRGDALIFDDAGIHRGAETKKTDRLVLRFIFKDINTPDY